MKKILRLEEIIKQEREEWNKLVEIGKSNDLPGFWKAYAEYLDNRTFMSPGRKFLQDMAIKTWKTLKNI